MRFLSAADAYYLGLGLLVGYIWWRLPDHLRVARARLQEWRESLPWNAREIARIEGGILPGRYVPNHGPHLFLGERIRHWWDTLPPPRTPEGVAEEAYLRAQKGIYEHK